MFAVLLINKTVIVTLHGKEVTLPIENCDGFLPVFNTREAAAKFCEERGSWADIVPITPIEKDVNSD